MAQGQIHGMLMNLYNRAVTRVHNSMQMSVRCTSMNSKRGDNMAALNLSYRSSVSDGLKDMKLDPYAMNGGQGPNSYAQNSAYQGGVVKVAKPIIEEEIATKLDINHLSHTDPTTLNAFRMSDFGSSTGHNSFPAIQMITTAVERVFESQRRVSEIPDFHVLFNDQVVNDFNALFSFLPPERNYYVAGVPGSFHGRLLPKASLHFAYSSCALNWLSEVPKEVEDRESPAWNKGRVHYTGAKKEVFEAYSNQYGRLIESFLEARAEELVGGGLMALLVPAEPSFKDPDADFTTSDEIDLLGSCLVDMAHQGRLREELVDSFNFPLYVTTQHELRALIEKNNSFIIERMEVIDNRSGKQTMTSASARAVYLRAVFEVMLVNHFGSEVIDELFQRYREKLEGSIFIEPENEKSIILCVVLKRKVE